MMAALARRARTLGDLLGSAAGRFGGLEISDLTLDSRQVTPGAAFVALAGRREHGVRFAAQAFAQGAAVVLYEPTDVAVALPGPSVAVPNLRARLPDLAQAFFVIDPAPTIVGVTGTNGKTTVAYLLAQALATASSRRCGYIGTLGFGVPPELTRHALTTPDCLTLHRELAELGAASVAMEVSSHALAQDRVAGLRFHTALFTNLTRDHLDEHGDFAAYGRAKQRLFERPGLACAVINADDPFAATLSAVIPAGCQLIRTTTRGARAELSATSVASSLAGLTLDIGGAFGAAQLTSKLVGDFNAENLLVALGGLLAAGLSLPVACNALARASGAPGRLEVLGGPPSQPWVVVDYAHTPDALERVLATLAAMTSGAVHVVFGCGGDRDRGKRPLMGAIAARGAARGVLTDDNPRGEYPAVIDRDILAGIDDRARVEVVHDRRLAIRDALAAAQPGDVVLIAGKGHETQQIVGAERRELDDRVVAAELLGERS
jgi:UDP-N-acetylmuramoyl-L-alanyl-D-glutamate--2,6-diaminopimelate ligase